MVNINDRNSHSLKSLYSVRDLINPLAKINFFIELGESATNYSDEQLASIIKADNYEKTTRRIAEFAQRQEERVERFLQDALAREAEYEEATRTASSKKPGSEPSDTWLNRQDPEAVSRYNREVGEYNSRLDLHRRLLDQAMRAQERYQDARQKYTENKADAEEKILEKKEELKPALDRDMVAFLGKLQQLVYDCFHNKGLFFETFALIFMAKKAYVFLYDRIGNNSDRTNANNTFRQLNGELEVLVKNNIDEIKQGFNDIVMYIYDCYCDNEEIFSVMQERLEQLPYAVCSNNEDTASFLASLAVDPNFQYKDVIDPNELSHLASRVQERCEQFNNSIAEIDSFIQRFAETFDEIAEVLADSRTKHQLMCQNKESRLGEAFAHSRFILGVFDEDIQNEYLKQQQDLLEAVQLEIETSIGMNLPKLVKTILETELLSNSAEQVINTNSAFAFLEYQLQLQNKKRELVSGVEKIDRQLAEIARQPQEKADEFKKKMQMLLGISILPMGNLGALFPIHQQISKFSPALGSRNPIYTELRNSTKGKLQNFFIAHAVLAALIGGGSFAVGNDQKPILLGAAGAYGVSAGVLFLKKKQLSDL
jgi:hypothetical protein